MGLDVLKQHLEQTPGIKEMAKVEGVEAETIIQDIMEKATYLQQSTKTFEDFSESLINVQNENSTSEQKQAFSNN